MPPPTANYFAVLEDGSAEPPRLELEMFLDYTCPFCAKIYNTVYTNLLAKLKGAGVPIRLVFKHLVQPWHPQSTLLHEAGLAVRELCGAQAFFKFSETLFVLQKEFFDANIWDKSRPTITKGLVELAVETVDGLDGQAMLELLDLVPDPGDGTLNRGTRMTPILKLAVKELRQRGAHVSPTCAVNGIIVDTSSSWSVEQWEDFLGPLYK
eukprot:m.67175 g.67175  ORF g.67175 m.67175 type:complete len:209 (-) comp8419_c0_seq1:2021-2647(-)